MTRPHTATVLMTTQAMKPIPQHPQLLRGRPNAAQLRAWFEELKRYEAALQSWDDRLTAQEARLREAVEDDWCAMENPCAERTSLADWFGAMADTSQADIAWLEGLYKLPDVRRKKK